METQAREGVVTLQSLQQRKKNRKKRQNCCFISDMK